MSFSGQKKYAEAEPFYLRLLALWENSAGPEHPMVALTLDKMVEFYNDQKLYEKSEPLAQRSLAMRTRSLIESFHRTGRVLVEKGVSMTLSFYMNESYVSPVRLRSRTSRWMVCCAPMPCCSVS